MAVRVDNWKMHIGVKPDGQLVGPEDVPERAVPVQPAMDPMEKMDPHSHEWGYVGRKFLGAKLWAPTAAGPFIAAHLKSLMDIPALAGRRHAQPEESAGRGATQDGTAARKQQLTTSFNAWDRAA